MQKFKLVHPLEPNVTATYGADHALGFFVEVRRPGQRRAEYDMLHAGYSGLDGALRFLAKHGFFTNEALDDALFTLEQEGSDSITLEPAHTPATVICALKDWTPPPPLFTDCVEARTSRYTVRLARVGDGYRVQVIYPRDSAPTQKTVLCDRGTRHAPLSARLAHGILWPAGFDSVGWFKDGQIATDDGRADVDFVAYPPEDLVIALRGMKLGVREEWLDRNPEVEDAVHALEDEAFATVLDANEEEEDDTVREG